MVIFDVTQELVFMRKFNSRKRFRIQNYKRQRPMFENSFK